MFFLFRDSNWDTWNIKGSIKLCSKSLHYHSYHISTVTDKSFGTSRQIFRLSKWVFPYEQQCILFAGAVLLRKIFGNMSSSNLFYSFYFVSTAFPWHNIHSLYLQQAFCHLSGVYQHWINVLKGNSDSISVNIRLRFVIKLNYSHYRQWSNFWNMYSLTYLIRDFLQKI